MEELKPSNPCNCQTSKTLASKAVREIEKRRHIEVVLRLDCNASIDKTIISETLRGFSRWIFLTRDVCIVSYEVTDHGLVD